MWLKANDSVLVYVIYHKSSVKGGGSQVQMVSHIGGKFLYQMAVEFNLTTFLKIVFYIFFRCWLCNFFTSYRQLHLLLF